MPKAKKKILILTHTIENDCVDIVSRFLKEKGAEVYRFDTDLFPLKSNIYGSFSAAGYQYHLKTPDFEIDLGKVDSMWYRRMSLGGQLQNSMPHDMIKPTIDESHASIWGVLDAIPAFKCDTYMKHRIANNKFTQLRLAKSLGLNIPSTIVTNQSSYLKEFFKKHNEDIIMKMHHSFAIYDELGRENVVFTNKFPKDQLDDTIGLQMCPLTFQENLIKKREYRITVVGDKIFSAAVDSQVLENAKLDWRKEGVALLNNWYPQDISSKLKTQILKLMDLYQLNYGAFDFIETHDGKLHFLEVNSGGEFMWLDLIFENKISEAVADLLIGNAPRREKLFPLFQ